jgi:hypothetical protein
LLACVAEAAFFNEFNISIRFANSDSLNVCLTIRNSSSKDSFWPRRLAEEGSIQEKDLGSRRNPIQIANKLVELAAAAEVVLVGDDLLAGRTGMVDQTVVNVDHTEIEIVLG